MIDFKEIEKYSKKLDVLYVEDNKTFAYDTLNILSKFFHSVSLSLDGKEAFQNYKNYYNTYNKYYDIVITDIFMPKLNGLELTKEIYKYNDKQAIIVISAHDDASYLLEFVNIGIEHFIVKPFDLQQLMEVFYNTSKKLNLLEDKIILPNNYTWDKINMILSYKGKVIKLTKKETKFLDNIIKNSTNIAKIEDILDTIASDKKMELSALNPLVSRVRKKLPEKLFESVYGIGYKLV